MSTTIASPNRPPNGLTWGKALKGVALVAVVAVAAVAAFYAIGLATGAAGVALATGGTAEAIAAASVQGVTVAANSIASMLGTASAAALSVWNAIPAFFGFTSTLATPAVATSATTIGTSLQVLGGGAAAAVTAHAVAPHLKSLTMTTPDVQTPADTSAAVLSQMKGTAAMHHTPHHDMSHTADMAKHAGHASHEPAHANRGQKLSPGEVPRKGWRDVFSNRQPTTQSLAPGEQPRGWSHQFTPAQNAASVANAGPRTHAPRDPNFAKQLDADRTNLRDILGDGGRA